MTYVYILYNYEEHGAEDVVTTLDRGYLIGMLERQGDKATPEDLSGLKTLLRRTEEELAHGWMEHRFPNDPQELMYTDGRHNLYYGWGGWVLQVSELYEPKKVKF